MSIAAMKQALEALYLAVRMEPSDSIHECPEMFQGAITSLRQAIAEAEKQEQGEIERLTAALKKANEQAEHFERKWYLLGDELEKLKQEQDEPVAEIHSSTLRWIALEDHRPSNALLYTTPQPSQKPWVGLTAEEREQVQMDSYGKVPHHVALIAAVEAKLKEKNNV